MKGAKIEVGNLGRRIKNLKVWKGSCRILTHLREFRSIFRNPFLKKGNEAKKLLGNLGIRLKNLKISKGF